MAQCGLQYLYRYYSHTVSAYIINIMNVFIFGALFYMNKLFQKPHNTVDIVNSSPLAIQSFIQ